MRDSDATLWLGKKKIGFAHNMLWFEGEKRAKIGAKNAQFLTPFFEKNTDAEEDFLDGTSICT